MKAVGLLNLPSMPFQFGSVRTGEAIELFDGTINMYLYHENNTSWTPFPITKWIQMS
jgi:hypothetical protein